MHTKSYVGYLLFCLFAVGIVAFNGLLNRDAFGALLMGYSLLFVLYLGILRTVHSSIFSPQSILIAGITIRIALLFGLPRLSDDCYRFLWDGHLWNHGIHPFAYTPRYIMAHFQVPGLDTKWLSLLNSPDYHTIYPPIGQFFFRIAAWIAQGNLPVGVFCLKVFLLLGEVLSLWVLYRWLKQTAIQKCNFGLALYAFNPLLLLETIGNCHFEGMMMGFVVLGMYCLWQGKTIFSGVSWAAGVAVKLLPLLLVPVALGWLGIRRGILFLVAFGVSIVVMFAPLADWEVLRNMGGSVQLYFQKFEFNASIYYVLAHISPWFTGWYEGRNISPALAFYTVVAALYFGWKLWKNPAKQPIDLQKSLLFITTIYLFNATTVHPWYILVPFVCSIGTGYWFPIVWTYTAFFSYSHYIGGGRSEQWGWITIEYLLVLVVLGFDLFGAKYAFIKRRLL